MDKTANAIYCRLLTTVRSYRWTLMVAMVATMISSGIDSGLAYLFKPLLDRGFIAHDQVFLDSFPLIVVGIFLARGFASFLSSFYLAKVARRVVLLFRQQIFSHLMALPARYYDNHSSGQILSKIIYDVEQIAKASSDSLTILVRETFFILGLIIVMFTVSFSLTLLFLISVPVIAGIVKISSRRMRRLNQQIQHQIGGITHVAEESIEGYKVVRLFGGQTFEQTRFNQVADKNYHFEMRVVVTNALSTAGVQLVAAAMMAIIIFLATHDMAHTVMTAGGFTAFISAIIMLLKPMKNLTTVNATIQKGVAGATSVFQFLDEPREWDMGPMTTASRAGGVVYRNVCFRYEADGRPILKDISFALSPGQTVALVGRSGSGKSTLVHLLPRFYHADSGQIFIDDVEIKAFKLTTLRSMIAMVSQHVTLFNGTIASNIAYGNLEEASETDILKVAHLAHVMEFVQNFPMGLQTPIGENGVLLSGGQRQRIAIARALLKNAPILILDEATASLDTESERHIQAALQTLIQNRTTLVIAHRLSTIKSADKILVIDKGEIVEEGKHDRLLENDELYAQLYRLQFPITEPN